MLPPTPVTLEGDFVRLEPLAMSHLEPLCAVGLDPSLWEWTVSKVATCEQMAAYLQDALDGQAAGTMLPFVTIERASGTVVGSSRYGNIDVTNRRLEIGWTWVAPAWQRTAINTEAKLLMMRHAFDGLGCQRVELKTDARNERSRRAILRLGAKEEGRLRKHMVVAGGRVRDTVYFSVIDDEWPTVEARLMAMLSHHAQP
ncbi:MAG: GNAT family N-acetyltransferase [Anaerolineales bacterium]|nr:GNAT family N-acetyltransferase [Anaerolineales bacterium]MCB9129046.1 GNAT family N-acetyltransferase [Ardenticatenales bacterium]MCB9172467.1 GNAT family N-acetyltransferase [Ardenticatenales bacterium]